MSGKKISPGFLLLFMAAFLLIAFGVVFSVLAMSNAASGDDPKGLVPMQLSMMLNLIVAGLALTLAGVGFQLAAGPKETLPTPGPPQPYGQAPQPQPQYQYQQQAPPPGQPLGQ